MRTFVVRGPALVLLASVSPLPLALWPMASAAAQIRTLAPLTSVAEEHTSAVLSPDSAYVAFRGPDKISVVSYGGGTEVAVAFGRNLGSFLWAPDSAGLYYMDGRELRFVGRNAGNPRLVATLLESGHALWAIKNDGSRLFGTWLYVRTNGGQTIRETQVFSIASDGSSGPQVLVQSVVVIDGVRLSPDETRMVYREYDATPFSRRDYVLANVDGSNPVSLTAGQGLGLNPDVPWWLADGSGICFARIDRTISKPVIETLSLTNPTPIPLSFTTPARNLSISADGRWIAYEGWWPAGSTWTPVVMPSRGGGHVFLDPSRSLVFSGTPMLGGTPSDRLIVSGNLAGAPFAQVLKTELARELSVTPRAEVGGNIDLELPATAAELGVVLMAAVPLPVELPVPGLAGGFQLDPNTLVTVLSGIGSGQGSLIGRLSIPNVPFLRRKAVYLQGVRLTSLTPTGDFTRLVELPIF